MVFKVSVTTYIDIEVKFCEAVARTYISNVIKNIKISHGKQFLKILPVQIGKRVIIF